MLLWCILLKDVPVLNVRKSKLFTQFIAYIHCLSIKWYDLNIFFGYVTLEVLGINNVYKYHEQILPLINSLNISDKLGILFLKWFKYVLYVDNIKKLNATKVIEYNFIVPRTSAHNGYFLSTSRNITVI